MQKESAGLASKSTPEEPLGDFLTRIKAMSSATYVPTDGGVFSSAWDFNKHLGKAENSGGNARRGYAEKQGR